MTLRYMIIGAGGTGAPLGAFLAKNGADVTLIARGAHLAAMQEKGLRFEQSDGQIWTVPVKAFDMDGFLAAKAQGAPSPDVIFVCVKGYSLDDTIPFIRSAAGEKTVVIPILNIYGTGRTMQAQLPGLLVTDGCIYISSNLAAPGVIQRHGSIFPVIFGTIRCSVRSPPTSPPPVSTRFTPPLSRRTPCSSSRTSPPWRPAASIIT